MQDAGKRVALKPVGAAVSRHRRLGYGYECKDRKVG